MLDFSPRLLARPGHFGACSLSCLGSWRACASPLYFRSLFSGMPHCLWISEGRGITHLYRPDDVYLIEWSVGRTDGGMGGSVTERRARIIDGVWNV